MTPKSAALRRGIPVEAALKDIEGLEAIGGSGERPVVEIWDREVAAVRTGRWDEDRALAWIHAPAGGAVRVSGSDRAPAPLPDALARGLEGIAGAVAAALGIL